MSDINKDVSQVLDNLLQPPSGAKERILRRFFNETLQKSPPESASEVRGTVQKNTSQNDDNSIEIKTGPTSTHTGTQLRQTPIPNNVQTLPPKQNVIKRNYLKWVSLLLPAAALILLSIRFGHPMIGVVAALFVGRLSSTLLEHGWSKLWSIFSPDVDIKELYLVVGGLFGEYAVYEVKAAKRSIEQNTKQVQTAVRTIQELANRLSSNNSSPDAGVQEIGAGNSKRITQTIARSIPIRRHQGEAPPGTGQIVYNTDWNHCTREHQQHYACDPENENLVVTCEERNGEFFWVETRISCGPHQCRVQNGTSPEWAGNLCADDTDIYAQLRSNVNRGNSANTNNSLPRENHETPNAQPQNQQTVTHNTAGQNLTRSSCAESQRHLGDALQALSQLNDDQLQSNDAGVPSRHIETVRVRLANAVHSGGMECVTHSSQFHEWCRQLQSRPLFLRLLSNDNPIPCSSGE